MSDRNNNDLIDQVFSINKSNDIQGSNIYNNNQPNVDLLDLDNFDKNVNNNKGLTLLDDEQKPQEEENQEKNEEKDEEQEKEEEEEETVEEVEVKKVDEQDKYILQQQFEKMKSIKAKKEIETEGDLDEIAHDDGTDNAKVNKN